MPATDVGARQDDFRPHRPQVEDLFLAHLVGQHDDELVALLCRNERQSETGIAGRCLDDRVARLDIPALLGLLDHRNADPVLDRATGVHEFELQE